MVVPHYDLQLLLSITVLRRPFRIIFPIVHLISKEAPPASVATTSLLHDLALLDNAFYLGDQQRADAHCKEAPSE